MAYSVNYCYQWSLFWNFIDIQQVGGGVAQAHVLAVEAVS
jgi:hypothetical protein